MLAHILNDPSPLIPGKRELNQKRTWDAIASTLQRVGSATTKELSLACRQSKKNITLRLEELRSFGEIRYGTPRGARGVRTWELGSDPTYREDEPKPVIKKAEQIGIQRDPLVAALFGAPAPFVPRVFDGLNIDSVHVAVGG